ncbi:MAG: SNF2-related protein [Pirellulales bacterium]
MNANTFLRPGCLISGPTLPERVEVLAIVPMGESLKIIGRGLRTGLVYDPVLNHVQIAQLSVSAEREPFDGDARLFRLGVEAQRLGLAYEYDPFFSLSIARVDPLPHQLEAVYGYFLKLPRIRFLLADDPGAGKTIMAGLLLKELKARGLVRRALIVTPANLTFQWQRELSDKFREKFDVIRGDVLRANYGQNPWQERDQVITSVSWVSIIEDARESLLRSRWDLIIVDEAHKMSAPTEDRKTYAYRLGESLSKMTDHYLLMTATPHKGDADHFRRFLALLDPDVYGSIQSLQQALRDHEAPFYLRRTKEALVTFPSPDTGEVRKLFTKREVRTAAFDLNGEELDFYDELTRYVEDQSMAAAGQESARARAIGFTMAMLQRRMASSIYAVRRSLERMRARRQKILDDPDGYRQEQIERKLPEDFEDLTEEERQTIIDRLEEEVLSVDPAALRVEIGRLTQLIDQAKQLEDRNIQTKLLKLKGILKEEGIFDNPKMKLLVFTEHKDTLDYLAADGRDERPLGKLREWGLTLTQIHGGMKVGDRDTSGSRIFAEREFRESAQVLVATEAAGEGINLQFCWLMVNFDIPWNPVRLEQRVGRIHRYGQEKDCLVFNFVAQNTREGRVLQTLIERLKEIREDLGSDQVFDVVGEVFPSNLLEKLFREMYARQMNEHQIQDRIVRDVSPERFREITESTLEGLAKKELNLSAIVGKSAEAKERRLVPEVIEQFFVAAAPETSLHPKRVDGKDKMSDRCNVYRIGKVPRHLIVIGDRQEDRFGRLGREYGKIVFDKALLGTDPTLEWVTPGHPLFETVRTDVVGRTEDSLRRGAVFYDLHRSAPGLIDVFAASIKDGRGHSLHRRLFVVETLPSGEMRTHEPTLLHDIIPTPIGTPAPGHVVPDRSQVELFLYQKALEPWVLKESAAREHEVARIAKHVEISLNSLIDRQNNQLGEFLNRQIQGQTVIGLDGIISQAEQHLDDLNNRLESRRRELELERHCAVADINHLGRAWIVPHPERTNPQLAPMVRDDEVERLAVQLAIAHEEDRGWVVESVESENRGFDLISRRPHREDAKTFIEVRFIEVKGRAGVGVVALSSNEYQTAVRLKGDYWLYVVFNCAGTPQLHTIQNPAQLGWQPVMSVEHYQVPAAQITNADARRREVNS